MLNKIKNILFVSYLKNKGIRRICFILGILFAITPSASWYDRLNRHFYDLSFNNINEVSQNYTHNTPVLEKIFMEHPPVNFNRKLYKFDNWRAFFIDKYSRSYQTRIKIMSKCNGILFAANPEKDSIWYTVQPVEEQPANDYWQRFEKVQPEGFSKKMKFKIRTSDNYIFFVEGDSKPTEQEVKNIHAYLSIYAYLTHKGFTRDTVQLADFRQPQKQDEKLRKICQKFDKYINQPIHISSYDFAYILELWIVIVAFYFPFLFCCLIRWIYMGFKEK